MLAQIFEFISNHPILVGLFAVLLALFIRNETQRGGKSLSSQELVNLVNREDALVVDVRDSKEFEAGHIAGAVNVPHSALEKRVNDIGKHKERPIILVCAMGQHSGAVGTQLRKQGFTNVARLKGGMAEWRNQNLPVVKA